MPVTIDALGLVAAAGKAEKAPEEHNLFDDSCSHGL
jgi:hypothetical protein